jgi:quinol monooxygenase YgiN
VSENEGGRVRTRKPGPQNDRMIFIVVKFTAKPEARDTFLEQVRPFTEATRAEEGVLWFDWSVSVDDPHQFVLVEAFRDADAGAAHVSSDHFRAGTATLSTLVAATPDLINVEVPGTSWSAMGEVTVE